MTLITYPASPCTDDTGAVVTPTSVTAMVKTIDGAAIANSVVTGHFSGADLSAQYDAAATGEGWIYLTPVLAGHTFASYSAKAAAYASIDSSNQGQTLADVMTVLADLTTTGVKIAPSQSYNNAGQTTAPAWLGTTSVLLASDVQTIEAAVAGITIEPGETLTETLRLLRAVLAGDSTVSGSSVTFVRADGTTAALTITTSSSGARSGAAAGTLT